MRILIAPDSFKESLNSFDVAELIKQGISEEFPHAVFDLVPMADGGEGTVDAVIHAVGGEIKRSEVCGPRGEIRNGQYGLIDDGSTAVLEVAESCGLSILPVSQRQPLKTTSYGCGQQILSAIDNGVRRIVLGIGGSATNDGGLGMCQALGAKFFDQTGAEIKEFICGGILASIHSVDFSALRASLGATEIYVACDVSNRLLGPSGATFTFGAQKGATPAELQFLEAGLSHAYDVIEKEIGRVVRDLASSGAAGGIGAALIGILEANLRPGVELISEITQLETRINQADLVITGEGSLDGQSIHGKTPVGVAKIAQRYQVPVIAIGGRIGDGAAALFEHGIDAMESTIVRPISSEDAINNAQANLRAAATRVGSWIKLAKRLNPSRN